MWYVHNIPFFIKIILKIDKKDSRTQELHFKKTVKIIVGRSVEAKICCILTKQK